MQGVPMKADVAFVSCVKTKADRSMMAKDLYISPWFKMARAYVEKNAESGSSCRPPTASLIPIRSEILTT